MACAMAVLVGALSVETFWLATWACDQPKLQGTVGSSLAERTTMVRLLRAAQATQVPSDTALLDSQNAKVATPSVSVAWISEPTPPHAAHEMRVPRRSAGRTRNMETPVAVNGATHSSRGTWLFLPNANGSG
jgi:hypothetical protein